MSKPDVKLKFIVDANSEILISTEALAYSKYYGPAYDIAKRINFVCCPYPALPGVDTGWFTGKRKYGFVDKELTEVADCEELIDFDDLVFYNYIPEKYEHPEFIKVLL